MSDKTIIRVPSQGLSNEVDGLWTVAEIKAMYGDAITGLSAMNGSAGTDETGATGVTRTLTFSPAQGVKGASQE